LKNHAPLPSGERLGLALVYAFLSVASFDPFAAARIPRIVLADAKLSLCSFTT
jgi:hypothetical protein